MPKKTPKSFRIKKADDRQPSGGRLEITDRDRDRFLAALDCPPKPLPDLERAAWLHARATKVER